MAADVARSTHDAAPRDWNLPADLRNLLGWKRAVILTQEQRQNLDSLFDVNQ